MKKIQPYTVFALLLVAFSFAAQAQNFQKSYDLVADDYVNMSVFNAADEVLSVGSSNYAGAGSYDAILTKVDASGTFQWEKQYGGSGTEFGTALAATTSGSGYVIAGRTNSGTAGGLLDIALIKVDNNGDIVWANRYGTNSTDYALSVAATTDNGYVVTGITEGSGNGGEDLFILKVDSNGTTEWFNGYGSAGNEVGYHVIQDPSDGGYVALGHTDAGTAGLKDVYLVKTDASGALVAQVMVGGTGDDSGRRILPTDSNRVLITGITRHQVTNSNDNILALMIDFNNFTMRWSRKYGSTGNDAPTNVVPLPPSPGGGAFAFSANTASFGSPKGMIFSTTADGLFQGGLMFGGATAGDVFFQDVNFNQNGTAVVTGFGNVFGGTGNDLYLISFQGDPNSLTCLKQQTFLPDSVYNVTLAGGPAPINTHQGVAISGATVAAGFSTATATANENDICSNLPLLVDAGPDRSVCSGGGTQLGGFPTAEGSDGSYTYAWTPTAGLDNPASSNPQATGITAETTFYVTVTDGVGGTATDSVTIGIAATTASISPPGPNICGGQNVTLTASPQDGISYAWTSSDGIAINEDTFRIVKNPVDDTTTYTVVITLNGGCTATASETVVMHPRPNVTITPNNPSICAGGNVQLNATSGQSYTTYVWTPATGLSNDSIANPVASPSNTTTYTLVAKNGHCAPFDNPTVTVTVQSLPTVTVTPSTATICDTASTGVTLTASGAATYSWSPSTGLSADDVANPVATPTATTTYTVTGSNACGDGTPASAVVTVDVCIGIFDIPQSVANVYPNPAKDNVTITFGARSASAGTLTVIGMDGKTELEMNVNITGGANNLVVDTRALPTGLYFVKIKATGVNAVGKMVKE